MIFSFPRLAAYATAIVLVGCASQRVVYHPSRQQPPKAPVTSTPAPSRPVAPTAPPPAYEPQPAPIVTSPAVPLYNEPLGNLTELRKNLSNTRAAEDIIEEKLTLAELEVAAATPAFSSVKPQLLLTLGKRHQKARQRDRAAEYYRSVSTLYPKTTQATQAAALLATIQMANTPADARVVGARSLSAAKLSASRNRTAKRASSKDAWLSSRSVQFRGGRCTSRLASPSMSPSPASL